MAWHRQRFTSAQRCIDTEEDGGADKRGMVGDKKTKLTVGLIYV